jgi:hypothetical protein
MDLFSMPLRANNYYNLIVVMKLTQGFSDKLTELYLCLSEAELAHSGLLAAASSLRDM